MNRLEEKIRDFLAINLSIIESDLTIVRKEYKLPNSFGSSGSIDILAKDSLGHYVIIEIKRSDQAARAALHELTKYVALLRSSLGVPAEKIRTLLVSTDWKELAVPFSDYLKTSEVPTAGYIITTTGAGEIVNCSKFSPIAMDAGLSISRQQSLILYTNATKRNRGIDTIIKAATRSQLSDFVTLTADYNGGNSQVIYPYGIYFGFSSPISNPESEESKRIMQALDWDEDLDDLEENFLCALMDNISGHDTVEIGYPEKLKLMEESGWSIAVVARNGRYQKNIDLMPDDQLISEFTKTEGGATYYLYETSSPKYPPSWDKFKNDLFLVLMGSDAWVAFFKALINELEADSSTPTISIQLYNPANILLGLSKIFGENDFRYLPSFQFVVSGEKQTTIYLGELAWDGVGTHVNFDEWIKNSYDSTEHYFIMHAFGEQYLQEDLACAGLGLQHVVYKIISPGKANESVFLSSPKDGAVISRQFHESDLFTMQDFCKSHAAFGRSLVNAVKSLSMGFIK